MNQFACALAKLNSMTARERVGLALLAAFAATALALNAFDWAVNSRADAEAAARARAVAVAASARADEKAFQEEVALAAGKVWRWSVVEPSAGVARAEASTQLETLALGAGLLNVSVAAAEIEETTSRLSAINLTLSADFDWQSFLNLLRTLENSELSFTVMSVEIAAGAPQTMNVGVRVAFVQEERQ
ncbi:MAG: hypothetical protein ABL883_11520 [Terricaulis sp.]